MLFRFVLLQMAAAKLLGMLIPRVVTHPLYSETPGGWVMPKEYYVTIITGWAHLRSAHLLKSFVPL